MKHWNQHENQSLLVATNCDKISHVIGVSGEAAIQEVNEVGSNLTDDLQFDPDDAPTAEPGVHVWEGQLRIWDDGDYMLDWQGTWRRATAADFARFGVPLEVAPS